MRRAAPFGLWILCACLAAAGPGTAQPTVSGIVTGPDGIPLAGAQVQLLPVLHGLERAAAPAASAVTGTAGRYALAAPGPALGIWRVVVRGAGMAPVQSPPLPLANPLETPPVVLTPAAAPPDSAASFWRPEEPVAPAAADARKPDPAAPRPPVSFSGRVLEEGTRKPLAGALVWPLADPGSFVRTGADGRFRLTTPGLRRFEIGAAAPGFLDRRAAVSRAQLASGQPSTLVLTRAATVQGKVVDPAGRPLPGAAVMAVVEAALGERAFDPADPVLDRAVSDAAGRFELRRLRPEEGYAVRAVRTGSFPAEQRIGVSGGASRPRTVTLVLAPARAGRGRVVDPAGKPVAGAEVRVRPALRPSTLDNPTPQLDGLPAPGLVSVRSDAKGVFQIAECPAPELELAVLKKGYAPVYLPAVRLAAGAGPADLGTVVLRPGVPLAGRVVDPRRTGEKAGIAGAQIFSLDRPVRELDLDRKLKGRRPVATSGADGSFSVADLPAGVPLHLVVRAPGFLAAIVRAVRPPVSPPLTVRLEPEEVLRGRVVDERGEPVATARVEMRWQDVLPEDPRRRVGEPILRGARVDAEGRFELRGFPARSSVHLAAFAPAYVGSEDLEVTLPRPAGSPGLRLVLERGAVLRGRVTTAAGEPVPAVRVGVRSATANTDDDGVYWLEGVETGAQEVVFVHPAQGRKDVPFEVLPGTNLLDLAFDAGQEVGGRAVDEDGKPVAGARVELETVERSELRSYRDVTGEDGRFRLKPVHDGLYRLSAAAAGFAESQAPGTVAVAGLPVENLEVVLGRGTLLAGKILGLEPEDLQKVEVTAYGEGGATLPGWTDGRGRYEVRALPPGDWTVRAALWDGQRRGQIRLVVARTDRELERDIELGARLTLRIQALYDEEPLPDARIALRGERFASERIVVTDYEGRCEVGDLEPDVYRLGLNHSAKMLVYNDQIELRSDRDVELRLAGSSFTGRVVSAESGDPVAGALLRLTPTDGPEFLISSGSGDDGSFAIHRIPPRRFRLETRAAGHAPAEQEIQLTAGQSLDGVEIRLDPVPGAKLEVRLAGGAVPPLVHLQIRRPAGEVLLAESRPTDPSGLLELPMLPPGTWEYRLRADGTALAAGMLLVPSEPQTVTLQPAGRLFVRVEPLVISETHGTLRLSGLDGQPFRTLALGGSLEESWVLVDGKALLDGVPAGTWTVQVTAADGQAWTGTVTTAGAGEMAVTLEGR